MKKSSIQPRRPVVDRAVKESDEGCGLTARGRLIGADNVAMNVMHHYLSTSQIQEHPLRRDEG